MNRLGTHDLALARRVALMQRIQRFIDGADISRESVALIEAGLDDAFPGNDWIADKVLMLASYRPGEGDLLHDEEQVRRELVKVMARLR